MLHCRNGGCEYYRLEVKNPANRSDAFRAAKYTSELPEIIFQNGAYTTLACRHPIKMSLLCQIEMTLSSGFAELAYEPSVLKRARSNNGSGFVGRCIGRRAGAALCRGSAPAR